MKTLGKILLITAIAVAILLVLTVTGLQIVLKDHLNEVIQQAVIPKAETTLGVNVDVGDASVNLLRGSLFVKDLAIGNPDTFIEPSILSLKGYDVDLGMRALLRGIVEVSGMHVDEAVITVVRNREKQVNVQLMQKRLDELAGEKEPEGRKPPPDTPPERPPDAPPEEPAPAEPLPKAILRELSLDTLVKYIDHTPRDQPFEIAFRIEVGAEGITTFPVEDWDAGTFSLRGHLDGNPEAFVTDLKGRVPPVTNPTAPDFDLDGTVAAVDMRMLQPVTEQLEVRCDSADIKATIRCRAGHFQQPESVLAFTFRNAQPLGELAKKTKGIPLPKDITVTVPLEGTIDAPVVDVQTVLMRTILETLARNPELLLKGIKVDEKTGAEINKALKSLGDFFK